MTLVYKTITARQGTAFALNQGEHLIVRTPAGGQVSDLYCYSADDSAEHLSTARSLDQADRLLLTTGDELVSNRGRTMLVIRRDDGGRHDLLLPPCRHAENGHPGCEENLARAFTEFGIGADHVGTAFNIFMRVESDGGRIQVLPSTAPAGAEVEFEACMDLLVGLTACAHLATNGGRTTSIEWRVF